MPCFALQNRGGKLNCLCGDFVVDGCRAALAATLGDHIARAGFATSALGGYTKFKLDLVKAHASVRVACDFAIGNSVANTNDHGSTVLAGYGCNEADYKCEFIAFANGSCLDAQYPQQRKGGHKKTGLCRFF